MNRREYISGVLVGTTVLAAGCNDEGDSSDRAGTTQEGPTIDPAESDVFDEHIRPHTSVALDALESAVGALEAEAARFDSIDPGELDHQVSQTVSEVETHLSTANDELGTAADAGFSHRFLWYIYGVLEFSSWVGTYIPFFEDAGDSADSWVAAHSQWGDGAYEDAQDNVSNASGARDLQISPNEWELPDNSADQHERLDVEAFNQLDSWAGSVTDSFSALGVWGQAMGLTGQGLYDVAIGLPLYVEAIRRYEDGEYEGSHTNPAAGMAESALTRFEEAVTHYEENRADVPSAYESTYSEYVCYAESMVDAATLRMEASRAAADNDMETARTKTDAAKQARNRCPLV